MRFLHTADWHVGKSLHGYDLLNEQQHIFQQIEAIAIEQKVDAIVIAGDLYDRSAPSEEAVSELNAELQRLNLHDQLPILAISGNHDSAARLATGDAWYSATQFYLHTQLAQAFEPVVIGDTQFFLLPYFELQAVRNYFGDDEIHSVKVAMERIVAQMQDHFAPDKHQVLVAHFFAAGSSHTDSETKVEVGGLNAVPVDLLTEFDYVALGHLHNPNALKNPVIKYSGSPLKMSASEAELQKGVRIVDSATGESTWVPLKPAHDVRIIKGSFDDLMQKTDEGDRDDFVVIQLTDQEMIPDVMSRLRQVYPRIIALQRVNGPVQMKIDTTIDPALDPMQLVAKFYDFATDGHNLNPEQKEWLTQSLQRVQKGE